MTFKQAPQNSLTAHSVLLPFFSGCGNVCTAVNQSSPTRALDVDLSDLLAGLAYLSGEFGSCMVFIQKSQGYVQSLSA